MGRAFPAPAEMSQRPSVRACIWCAQLLHHGGRQSRRDPPDDVLKVAGGSPGQIRTPPEGPRYSSADHFSRPAFVHPYTPRFCLERFPPPRVSAIMNPRPRLTSAAARRDRQDPPLLVDPLAVGNVGSTASPCCAPRACARHPRGFNAVSIGLINPKSVGLSLRSPAFFPFPIEGSPSTTQATGFFPSSIHCGLAHAHSNVATSNFGAVHLHFSRPALSITMSAAPRGLPCFTSHSADNVSHIGTTRS